MFKPLTRLTLWTITRIYLQPLGFWIYSLFSFPISLRNLLVKRRFPYRGISPYKFFIFPHLFSVENASQYSVARILPSINVYALSGILQILLFTFELCCRTSNHLKSDILSKMITSPLWFLTRPSGLSALKALFKKVS